MNVIWCGILATSECPFSMLFFGRKSYKALSGEVQNLVGIHPTRQKFSTDAEEEGQTAVS